MMQCYVLGFCSIFMAGVSAIETEQARSRIEHFKNHLVVCPQADVVPVKMNQTFFGNIDFNKKKRDKLIKKQSNERNTSKD